MPEQQDDDTISKPSIMAAHLGRLQREHHLVSIGIDGTSNTFNSMLVNVDPENQTMLLDILHPEPAHQQLLKKKAFSFNVNFEGVKISFRGQVKKLVEDEGKPAYLVKFPNTLIYKQRRKYFRAPISRDIVLPIVLTDSESETQCEGIINNISRGGLGLQFEHTVNFKFKQFQLVTGMFKTPDNKEIRCELEIRNITDDSAQRYTIVGVKFKDLNKLQKRHIQQFELNMERQMMQRKRA